MLQARAIAYLALLTIGSSAISRAGEVTVRGSSTGFVMGQSGLSFQGGDFAAITTGGIGSFTESNRLGVLFLSPGSLSSRSATFILRLDLATDSGNVSTTRALRATVTPNQQGGVSIHFTTPEARVRFDDGNTAGSFAIKAQDLSLEPGESAPLLAALSGSEETDTACRLTFTAARAVPAILPATNQAMTPVVIQPAVSDRTACAVTCKIDSVGMNAPAGPSDYQITGDLSLKVRATGLNSGIGRIYNVAVRCTDKAGNTVTQNAPVVVH